MSIPLTFLEAGAAYVTSEDKGRGQKQKCSCQGFHMEENHSRRQEENHSRRKEQNHSCRQKENHSGRQEAQHHATNKIVEIGCMVSSALRL